MGRFNRWLTGHFLTLALAGAVALIYQILAIDPFSVRVLVFGGLSLAALAAAAAYKLRSPLSRLLGYGHLVLTISIGTYVSWSSILRSAGGLEALSLGVLAVVTATLLMLRDHEVGVLRFRVARSTNPLWNVPVTILQFMAFWGVFLVLLPWWIVQMERASPLAEFSFGSQGAFLAGVALLAIASFLGIWSAVTMATRGQGTPVPLACTARLVVTGPYQFVRNPMAVAGITQGVAVGLMWGSPTVVAYAVAGGIWWHCLVRPIEEGEMVSRFGDDYVRYRASRRCWLPILRSYRSN